MAYEAVDCIDAGTDYCPCYLAETNNCLICSQLQGKVFCDCVNWKGVCIYQEYKWNGSKMKEPRENVNVEVLERRLINPKIIFLKLKVTKTLARELNQPGSYIFLRDENYPEFFNVPMSIMYSDEINQTIDLLIQIRGIKTKVLNSDKQYMTIRGPYWNGLIGLKNLKVLRDKNCILVARGIAQAPSVIVAKKLVCAGNKITVILDPGSSSTDFSRKYFESLGCSIIETGVLNKNILTESVLSELNRLFKDKKIDLIFSGGSDILHKSILNIINSYDKDILFACTNNANICCGEGICGSCSTRLKDGRRIKSCKAQVDPVDILGGK